ncbi:MAG: hypothetical protein KAQ72_08190 [Desulfobacula sp.]|nr:hypothetical protein [Desulfobacula sp.]
MEKRTSFIKFIQFLGIILLYIIFMATWDVEAKNPEESEDSLQQVTLQLP